MNGINRIAYQLQQVCSHGKIIEKLFTYARQWFDHHQIVSFFRRINLMELLLTNEDR